MTILVQLSTIILTIMENTRTYKHLLHIHVHSTFKM